MYSLPGEELLIAALLFFAEHFTRREEGAGYHLERGLLVVGGV